LNGVACIGRLYVEVILAVGVRSSDAVAEVGPIMMNEVDGPEIGRIERIPYSGVLAGIRKYAGSPKRNSGLPAEFRPKRNGMEHWAGGAFVDEIGLVEEVVAIGRVVVGRAIECGIGKIHRACQWAIARIDVLIELQVFG